MNSQSEQCFARTAANASRGPEQLQKLQLQKQDRRQSIASSREGIFMNSQREQLQKPEHLHVTLASAMRVCQPAQYTTSILVQCISLFLNERTLFLR